MPWARLCFGLSDPAGDKSRRGLATRRLILQWGEAQGTKHMGPFQVEVALEEKGTFWECLGSKAWGL